MKVKTFTASLKDGYTIAFQSLDQQVELNFGGISFSYFEVHDQIFPKTDGNDYDTHDKLVRRVVYRV